VVARLSPGETTPNTPQNATKEPAGAETRLPEPEPRAVSRNFGYRRVT
jgi:hypothetical protein